MSASRRSPDAEGTRGAILEAARALFLEKGYAATSVAEVARAARVTKSLIHHHFSTKEHLWAAVKLEVFGEYGRAQRAILEQEGSAEEVMRRSFAAYFRFLQSRPEVVRLLAMDAVEQRGRPALPDVEPDGEREGSDLFVLGVERIRAAQRAGQARADVDPASVLAAFFALAEHWFMVRHHIAAELGTELNPELDERYLEDATSLLAASIRPLR